MIQASEIVQKDPFLPKDDLQYLEATLEDMLASKKAIAVRHGDTIMLLISIADGAAEAHIFTIDPPLKVSAAIKEFIKQLRSSELRKIYSNIAPETPKMLRLLRIHGLEIEDSDLPNYSWMASV